MQLCKMHNKSICEAAGAPTVPPPNFNTSSCYGKPDNVTGSNNHKGGAGNASGFYNSGLCKDYRGVATVIHGLKGVFCARPCSQAGQLSCDTCKPECQIKNASTGACAYCSGECATEQCGNGKTYPACTKIDPCKPQSKLVCDCPVPDDDSGRPVLALPQCILTGCGCTGTAEQCGSGNQYAGRVNGPQPLCALTCDPSAKAPTGRSICPTGMSCEAAPGASFSPAGVCTYPVDRNGPTPYTPGDTPNKTAASACVCPLVPSISPFVAKPYFVLVVPSR